jgi:hypothetical protein
MADLLDTYLEAKEPVEEKSGKSSVRKGKKEEETKKSKRKSSRKTQERDPDEPKKPLTAFMLYCNHRRSALREDPKSISRLLIPIEMTENEKLKIIGEEWKKMQEADKTVLPVHNP